MPKHLFIPLLNEEDHLSSTRNVSVALDALPRTVIGEAPWTAYPYKPGVQFSIAHTNNHILLKYFVTEKEIRATHYMTNQKVFEDSCVEFFISFDEKGYYNFEFNCIGTCLAAYGTSKEDRTLLPESLLSQIKYQALILNDAADQNLHWELTLVIPIEVFCKHIFSTLPTTATANFYKCGDLLKEAHFLSWTPIDSPVPNFHLPDYFGQLQFER